MKLSKPFYHKKAIALFLLVLLASTPALAQNSPLETEANQKIETLEQLIAELEGSGIDVLREKMTVRTATVFLQYANWDEQHLAENTKYFGMVQPYKNNAAQLAEELPDFERKDVIQMLDSALVTLRRLKDGTWTRKASPNVDWSEVTHQGNSLFFNNRPVFLADYTWKPKTEALTEYHGQLDGFFISPNHVVNAAGDIANYIKNQLATQNSENAGFVFIAHKNIPNWAKEKYGESFAQISGEPFHKYDIDNPGARELIAKLLAGTVPQMAGKKYTQLGYMLANEPRWLTYKDGTNKVWYSGGVSNFTLEKFKVWLKEKHGTIDKLNAIWGTSFSAFETVELAIPIELSRIGSPQWYDWTSFNDYRVTNWFAFMKNEIQKHDPAAKVHLKIIPKFFSENLLCSGIDLEALTELSEINGNDVAAEYSRMRGETPWDKRYQFGWSELWMSFDFMQSVRPKQLNFNTESHLLNGVHVRDLYMKPEFVRAIYWAAHTLGMNASQTWYWPRREDGSLRQPVTNAYAGSNNQQPRVTNELHTTLMDLNAYSEEITAMQNQRKPIRLFYSRTTAAQHQAYMDEQFELYEALNFEGIPLGFATKNIITQQDNTLWNVILVHKTTRVTAAERDALQAYLNRGGTVVVDANSLTENEYGQPIAALEQGQGNIIRASSVADMKTKALELLQANKLLPEVSIAENNGQPYKTCTWKCIKNKAGNNVLSIINLGKNEAKLTIKLNGKSTGFACTNLLNGTRVSNQTELKPYGMLFVELTKDKALNLTEPQEGHAKMGVLSPNPSEGAFNIKLDKPYNSLQLHVYTMHGKLVSSQTYEAASSLSHAIYSQPKGSYLVKLIADEKTTTFTYIKN